MLVDILLGTLLMASFVISMTALTPVSRRHPHRSHRWRPLG
ncbi:hypothetical protein [Actinoplanes sp. URMC 104]